MAEIVYDAALTPDQITWAARSVPTPANLVLSGMVPTRYIQQDKVRWGEITRRNQMAKYRAFDGAIARARRDTAADQYVTLAPFSNSLVAGEYESLQKQYALMQGGNRAVLVNAILDDTQLLMDSMYNRIEKALGSVLSTGKFTVNENRTMFEADYGVATANMFTAGTVWSNPSAKAADDLRAMRDRYVVSAGVAPGRMITSQAVYNSLLRNTQIVAEAIGTLAGRTYLTSAELTAWLATSGLPTIITQVETSMYNDETDADERVMPQNKIVMLPENLNGVVEFVYGLSATALELINSKRSELSFGSATGVVGMVVKDGPPFRQFTYTDAVGLPVLYGARQVVIGTVL